ncbi:hypothetical protein ACR9E3_28755 [Actinomycetospora sp. C-140]
MGHGRTFRGGRPRVYPDRVRLDHRCRIPQRSHSAAAGSDAVHADSTLARRLRDIGVLRQHFLVERDVLTAAGAVLSGGEAAVPVF